MNRGMLCSVRTASGMRLFSNVLTGADDLVPEVEEDGLLSERKIRSDGYGNLDTCLKTCLDVCDVDVALRYWAELAPDG